jgi:hypothetical protein
MGGKRVVDVERRFRRAGGAAGEVQQRRILGRRRRDGKTGRSAGKKAGEVGLLPRRIDQNHVRELSRQRPQRSDAPLEQAGRRDQHPGAALLQPNPDRLGAEAREQRRENGAGLQTAKGGDVERGHPAEQREDALTGADAEAGQHVGEAAAQLGELAVAQVLRRAIAPEEAKRQPVAVSAADMPVEAGLGHVPAASRAREQLRPGRLPRVHLFSPFADSVLIALPPAGFNRWISIPP